MLVFLVTAVPTLTPLQYCSREISGYQLLHFELDDSTEIIILDTPFREYKHSLFVEVPTYLQKVDIIHSCGLLLLNITLVEG